MEKNQNCAEKRSSRSHLCDKLWFHLAGLGYIVWFLARVLPAPRRALYPCQQVSATFAMAYITVWAGLWHGLTEVIRRHRQRITAIASVSFVLIASAGIVFAFRSFYEPGGAADWEPISKDPIGTPRGVKPGRVVWVWDADATETELSGFWWESQNNNQEIIDRMCSWGIQWLAGVADDHVAWDRLFRGLNERRGRGDVAYEYGEKIAIKINMNNSYFDPYGAEDNEIDASPYVVKALLRQLVDVVGVAQEDITVYDVSRPLMDWFYNRVVHEAYPASPQVLEFPNVNYVDSLGGAPGRRRAFGSPVEIHFSDGTGLTRSLPLCVVEANYVINMPILKKHIGDSVTLAGKNMFGGWMEDIVGVHDYHYSGHTMGNTAPQTDLFAHEHLGGKTLLLIGDATFACRMGNRRIARFQMSPFNDDWMSSLFFSQDLVAIDSVMYDFIKAEGSNPSEGTQNYLHQAADPPPDVYDPEGDGVFVQNSLGVHEHWDTTVDILSKDRYSGPAEGGIDFIADPSGPPPKPAMKAGGADDELIVSPEERISVTVGLTPGALAGQLADWWVGALTPFGAFWLNPSLDWVPSSEALTVGQYPLFDLEEVPVLEMNLPPGDYVFFYVIDCNPNGVLDDLEWLDTVDVISTGD